MPDILDTIGKNIRKHRQVCGWSQEKLADHAGLHRTYVGAVERGEKNISAINIDKIARVLNISSHVLLKSDRT